MLIKYLLNKKYRENYSKDISLRFKKSDEQLEINRIQRKFSGK